ncbi:uncharacterized protein LOC114326357 isoform X2 [Diabrotica virgifera virgifera]|uniref:Gustatory receptor n=1 Tax=Diabrotica virgifera virgifera TaxID=50390 RepID=A0ABM5JHX5_DIAVI|nr:uncharacterized protein LOC114326357 isoform X2 [Diabrotica virgifera virgifera]
MFNCLNMFCDSYDSDSSEDTEIVSVAVPDSSTHLSVTTVLNYCKSKILRPYLRFLGFMGLRPLFGEQQDAFTGCWKFVNVLYTSFILVILVMGYILQYMSCFRRERGFYYVFRTSNRTLYAEYTYNYKETCDGSIAFSFILPSLLHFVAYLHIMFVFRNTDDEQLPVLMERVFLASTTISNGFISQRKLLKTLWLFITSSIIWISLSFAVANYMLVHGEVHFKWIGTSVTSSILLKVLLIMCSLWHDLVQSTIVSNYCLQAQLLSSYVKFMREKLLQFPVQPLEWMRDIEDFKKLLKYFNSKISPSVCLLTIMDASFALSGTLWMVRFYQNHKDEMDLYSFSLVNIFNVILWALIALAPFVQAARLTNACEVLKTVGQEVRARPYVHSDTPTLELDSVLLYTTSLKINAQLFNIPVTGKTLFFGLTIGAVCILTFGQLCYFITK